MFRFYQFLLLSFSIGHVLILKFYTIALTTARSMKKDWLTDYTRVDMSIIYRFKLKGCSKIKIGVSVWNLLDKENTINTFFKVDALGKAEKVEQHSLGITTNAVLRIYF